MKFDIVDSIKRIKIQYKVTFLSAIIFGLLSQGMGLFNKYAVSDEISNLFNFGATTTSGRWMLEALSRIEILVFGDGHYSLPVFNGFISIIIIAITACLFVSLLEINNNTLCVCVGGIMTVFPVITGMFGVMFTIPSYMVSLLLGVLGSYLVCKNNGWKDIVVGIVIMTCSVGIYQAFIPVIISTFVFHLIVITTNDGNDINTIVREMIKIFVSIILFMLLYFAINKLVLSINDLELTTYQGIDKMGKASIGDYLYRVAYAFGKFFILNPNSKYYMYYGNIKYIYYLILIVGIILMILMLVSMIRIDKLKAMILGLLFISIPLASNFIFVMVDADYVHALMVYGQVMPFIIVCWLLDAMTTDTIFVKYITIIGTVFMLIINVMFVRFDNECYLKAEFTQQETINYFNTLVTRIKSIENYDDKLPVSFLFIDGGRITDETMYIMNELEHIRIIPYDNLYDYVNNYVWKIYMQRWCGFNPEIVDGSDLNANQEVLSMPCYPDYGSIKVIDNRVVVRFQ